MDGSQGFGLLVSLLLGGLGVVFLLNAGTIARDITDHQRERLGFRGNVVLMRWVILVWGVAALLFSAGAIVSAVISLV